MPLLPVPEIDTRDRILTRKCFCGVCLKCRRNDAAQRIYRRRKAGIPARRKYVGTRKDIDMESLDAYWEKVKCE